MIFFIYFIKILIAMMVITFMFGNADIKAGLISTAILFVVSIGIMLMGGAGLFGTIFFVIISYVLFLTVFKMETYNANVAAAGLFAFMFLLSLVGF